MDERIKPENWTARADDEGQVSIYDSRGFVAAVPDMPTALLIVAHHNAGIYRVGELLFYERWASEVNYELWQKAEARLEALGDLDLRAFAGGLADELEQVYARTHPNGIAHHRSVALTTIAVVMARLEAALRRNGTGADV